MRRTRSLLAASVAVAFVLAALPACKKKEKGGKSAQEKTTPRKTEHKTAPARKPGESRPAARPASTVASKPAPLPAGLSGMQDGPVKIAVGIRLSAAKKSAFWPLIMASPKVQKFLQGKEYQAFKTACKVDPVTAIDEVTVLLAGDFINKSGAEPTMGLKVKGSFDENSAIACLKTFLSGQKDLKGFKDETIGGKKGFSFVDEKGEKTVVYAAGKGVVVVAQDKGKDLMLKGGCATSPIVKAIKDAIPKDATLWIAFGNVPIKADKLQGPLAALKKVKKVVGGYLYVAGTGTPYVLHAALDVGSPEAAKVVDQTINMLKPMALMMLSQKPELQKLKDTINSLQVKVTNTAVYLSLPMAADVAGALKGLAGNKS